MIGNHGPTCAVITGSPKAGTPAAGTWVCDGRTTARLGHSRPRATGIGRKPGPNCARLITAHYPIRGLPALETGTKIRP